MKPHPSIHAWKPPRRCCCWPATRQQPQPQFGRQCNQYEASMQPRHHSVGTPTQIVGLSFVPCWAGRRGPYTTCPPPPPRPSSSTL